MKHNVSDEHEVELGQQLRALRIRQDLDQRQLATRAGVALNVVKRLESGKGATLASFVKVLRVLGRSDWLNTLAPTVSVSPLQMVKTTTLRQRASPKSVRGRV
jgi:transcriptional regulator with XRE-family HTH domain